MAGVWPDPIANPIKTAGLEDDSDTITGASGPGTGGRQSLEDNMGVLSSMLNAVDAGSSIVTTANSGTFMKTTNTTGAVANEICRLDTAGKPIKSGTTISTSVLNNNTTVPTGAAVQTYVTGAVGAALQVYEVNLGTLTTSTKILAHGVASVFMWQVVARCVSANNGYVAGDELQVGSWSADHDSGGGGDRLNYGGNLWVNATVVGGLACTANGVGDKYRLRTRTASNTAFNLNDNASWNFVFKILGAAA